MFTFIVKPKFLYNNPCKSVCKPSLFLKVLNILKALNNSGMKMIELVKGGLSHPVAKFSANFLARFVFTTD